MTRRKYHSPSPAGHTFTKEELTYFVKLCFDNTTAEDVSKYVLPELKRVYRGSGHGLCEGLTVSTDGVCVCARARISTALLSTFADCDLETCARNIQTL